MFPGPLSSALVIETLPEEEEGRKKGVSAHRACIESASPCQCRSGKGSSTRRTRDEMENLHETQPTRKPISAWSLAGRRVPDHRGALRPQATGPAPAPRPQTRSLRTGRAHAHPEKPDCQEKLETEKSQTPGGSKGRGIL